ncbi:ATP-dependent RNA helicase vasa [Bradysia coprophila]|uniref:ATP-dependent RNA helicase vasa n=1 Tax=Bradysia coprophila TaxID=38358 RepID=UPI00187DA162|nr:ATP-dependent RNA helicase vasa [Bradysia coprophila]
MADEWEESDAGFGRKFGNMRLNGSGDGADGRRGRGGGSRGGSRTNGDGGSSSRNFNDSNGENGDYGNNSGNENRSSNGRGGRERGDRDTGRGFSEFKDDKPREFYIPPDPSTDEREIFSTGIESGLNFAKYDKIPIKVTGRDTPKPILNFRDSGLSDYLLTNVAKCGYKEPTPIQKTAIPIIKAKRDLMACAQTGSGKTAAFILPILNALLSEPMDMKVSKPQVVIISPTRELAIQIFNEVRKFSYGSYLKSTVVYGGTASRYQSSMVLDGCHVLVATPGRLLDFVDKCYITFEDIRFVVLDEADRMLDLGFMPNVNKIMNHPTMVKMHNRQTLMFSATFPEEIQLAAGEYLRDYIFVAIGIIGGACTDVEQIVYDVKKYDKREKLIKILDEADPTGTMVFVETKRDADFLASFLSETKHPTTSIHGDREQRQREEALAEFKAGRMKILIATSVAARGLDIPNVNHVINYNLPKQIEDYVHRIGRTGRVGNRGKATSFYEPDEDAAIASNLKKILEDAGQPVPDFLSNYGGGSYNGRSNFGGRDVRRRNNPIAVQEEPEEW